MARPKTEHPTPAELEVLKLLWEHGPMTVRATMERLKEQRKRRAYTTVMSLMNVMTDKGLLRRKPNGRAFVYFAKMPREKALGRMVGDLWQRAFEGSATALVTQLLDQANPSEAELEQIRRIIADYEREHGDE